MSAPFVYAWVALTAAILALETAALLRRKAGDTASETVWALFARFPWVRIPAFLFWSWLTAHLFAHGIFVR